VEQIAKNWCHNFSYKKLIFDGILIVTNVIRTLYINF